jgi:hypothetical protein
MFDRVEKELKDLDASTVNFEDGHWTWGCGGHPLNDREYFISYTADGCSEIRYKLPECINQMLRLQYRYGGEHAMEEIRRALGVR